MTTTAKLKRFRLYGKKKQKFPKPSTKPKNPDSKKGFELRLIREADNRYSCVKTIKRRLTQLLKDAACDSMQREILAGRAIFLAAHLESLEVEALEGKDIDWGSYVHCTNCLNGILTKLGLDRQLANEVTTLEKYMANDDGLKKQAGRPRRRYA